MNRTLFDLKAQFSHVLNRTGLPQIIIARSRWRIVLAFHRVISRTKASELGLHPSLFITPETFKTLLSSLKQIGNFIDVHTLLSGTPSRTSFSVTFDDGWIDTYAVAYPILKELDIPFSIFIATSLVNKGIMNWTEEIVAQYVRISNESPEKAKKALMKLNPIINSDRKDIHAIIEALKDVPDHLRKAHIDNFYNELSNKHPLKGEMLSWDQIKELMEEGVIIGSHTHSHSVLKGLTREQVAAELSLSKEIIQDQLALDAKIFCYPNGRYNKGNEDIFSSLGFNHGFILDDKRIHENNSPFFIPRFLVYEDIVPILLFRFLTEHK